MKKQLYLTIVLIGLLTTSMQLIETKRFNSFTDLGPPPEAAFFAPENQSVSFYIRKANHAVKKQEWVQAAAYSAKGLLVTDKKKKISKLENSLNASYMKAVQANMDKAQEMEASLTAWEDHQSTSFADQIANLYIELNLINKDLNKLPAGSFEVKNSVVRQKLLEAQTRLNQYKTKSAAFCYAIGVQILREDPTREGFKRAYYEFENCTSYDNNYKDAAKRQAECKEAATLRVLIENFSDKSGKRIRNTNEVVKPHLMATLNGFSQYPFLELYEEKPQGKKIDFFIEGELTDVFIHAEDNKPVVKDVSQTLLVEVLGIGGKVEEVKKKFKGELTIYSRTKVCNIKGVYRIEDADGTVRNSDDFTGTYANIVEWARFKGDKRALNRTEKGLVAANSQENAKDAIMISSAMPNAIANLSRKVNGYASRIQ